YCIRPSSSRTKLMEQMTQLASMCEMVGQIIQKKQEEKRFEEEQAAKAQNSKILAYFDDDDDYNFAITPMNPLTLSSLYDEDVPEKFFSNPLFEEEIIPMKIDQHHFNAESDLIESLLNHDSFIIPSSSKIDSLLDEFVGELTLLKSIPPKMMKQIVILRKKFILPRDCCTITHLLDSDSFMGKIDLSFTPDDPMPTGIKEDDYDSERDILIHEELLDNYSLSLPIIESYHFDNPLFSRPPAKPPNGNTGILNIKMMGDNSKQKVPIPGHTITRVSNQEKSPDLLSHQGLENFQLYAKCPMMIHRKNILILDVPLFHFYLLDQFKYGGN
nr:hypothetical protein [Tanacetum cinerariifolium]